MALVDTFVVTFNTNSNCLIKPIFVIKFPLKLVLTISVALILPKSPYSPWFPMPMWPPSQAITLFVLCVFCICTSKGCECARRVFLGNARMPHSFVSAGKRTLHANHAHGNESLSGWLKQKGDLGAQRFVLALSLSNLVEQHYDFSLWDARCSGVCSHLHFSVLRACYN